jgi:hypothetical protein
MSIPYIWCNIFHTIAICAGQRVYRIQKFHACHYGLHPVAPDEVVMLKDSASMKED